MRTVSYHDIAHELTQKLVVDLKLMLDIPQQAHLEAQIFAAMTRAHSNGQAGVEQIEFDHHAEALGIGA